MKKLVKFLVISILAVAPCLYAQVQLGLNVKVGTQGTGTSGVQSINGVLGAFTFTGSGVSCGSTTCTFTGAALPVTTKGDLLGYSTVAARVPVGSDGQVLTADSTQALGLKWAATSAGSGVQYPASNTQYYFLGSSQLVHVTDDISGTPITVTAISCNGTTCTATASNTLTTSDYVYFPDTQTYSPNCISDANVKVASRSGTQFTFAESDSWCSGTPSGTGGSAYIGTHLLSAQLQTLPWFSGHGTTHMVLPNISAGAAYQEQVIGINSNYTTYVHPLTQAVTGNPTTFYIMAGLIDLGAVGCQSISTVESQLQTLWNSIHTDGSKVYELTDWLASPRICDGDLSELNTLNKWVTTQVCPAGVTTNCVDGVIGLAEKIADYSNSGNANSLYSDGTHLSNFGAKVAASIINNSMPSMGSFNNINSPSNGPNWFVGSQSIFAPVGVNGGACLLNTGAYSALGVTPNTSQLCYDAKGAYQNSYGNLAIDSRWTSGTTTLQNAAPNNGVWAWMDGTDHFFSNIDTGLNRLSAGVVGLGNGSKTDTSGTLKLANLFASALGSSTSSICTTTGGQLTNSGCLTAITGTVTVSSPITISGSGTTGSPYSIACPTCGTSSATNVTINGGTGLGTANLNDTTPATATGGTNVKWQQSGSNVSAYVPATPVSVVIDTSTPITVSTTNAAEIHNNQNATAATAITYNLPTAVAGKQFCFTNSYNGSAANTGVLTIATSATGQFIIFTDGTLSATGGNVTSGGAASDASCMVGVDSTHWQMYTQRGTWTKH